MGKEQIEPPKACPKDLLSSYPVLYPTYTTFSFKNFKSAVNFKFDNEELCKKKPPRDVIKPPIIHKQILEFPLKKPKCCFDAYKANVERQRQKNLQKFGFVYSGKKPDCEKKGAEEKPCAEEKRREKRAEKITYFPECYLLKDSDSENEDEEEVYKTCSSGSESECSACSTLGGGTRRKLHKVVKKDWRELLHRPMDPCKEIAQEELRKYKSRQFFNTKVKKNVT